MITHLLETVDERAAVIRQRILHEIGGDAHGDEITRTAPLTEDDARPPARGGGLLFAPFQHLGLFQFRGDGRDRRRGKAGVMRDIRMRKRPVPTQRRKDERAVLLTHKLRARLHQHRPFPPTFRSCNTCPSQSICLAVIQGLSNLC